MSRDIFECDEDGLVECSECGFTPDDEDQIWCRACGAVLTGSAEDVE